MVLGDELLDLLVCPRCHGRLRLSGDQTWLDCEACRLRFPVEDDIPVMLVEKAQPMNVG
ncbi:MAG: Trm112 family protein [Candidatus Binatia bacterium]